MTAHRGAVRACLALALLLAAALLPARGAALTLLDRELALARAAPDLRVAAAQEPAKDGAAKPASKGAAGSLDFDLLGDAPKAPAVEEDGSLRTRRKMLDLHQGFGIGLMALQVASTVTGQLNYEDKFSVDNTGRYRATHMGVTYTNLAVFATTGAIALFAPGAKGPKPSGIGRTTIHKIGMGLATLGMIGQGILGVQTAHREGYVDQRSWGRKHLALGYATLAVMSIAVGAIVF